VRRCEKTTLQTPRSVKKEGGGGARDTTAESLLLQFTMKTMVRKVVPLQSMEVHSGADITESQNHRMVGVGRDLCGSSSPTLLPKQGHLQ